MLKPNVPRHNGTEFKDKVTYVGRSEGSGGNPSAFK